MIKLKEIIVFVVFTASITTGCGPQNKFQNDIQGVEINLVTSIPLGDLDTIFITGSNYQLGHWSGQGIPFIRKDPLRWSLYFNSEDSAFSYKITLGSWKKEGLLNEVGSNRDLGGWIGMDTVFHCDYFGPAERIINGQISGYHEILQSPIDPDGMIPSRRMWVWSPYDFRKNKRDSGFDILLMSDGQNVIDPSSSTYGVDWAVDESIISLIDSNIIDRDILVVALDCSENGNNRRLEYGPGDLGDATIKYLTQTIIPFVLDNYPVTGDMGVMPKIFFAGSSMGGVLGFRLATEYDDFFDGVMSFSPAVLVNAGNGLSVDALTPWAASGYKKPTTPFYIDNGGLGLESQLQPGIDLLLANFDSIGLKRNKDYLWIKDPASYHGELGWRERFPSAFSWVFNSSKD